MKLCQIFFRNYILVKFQNGSGLLKNMAASGQDIFPYNYGFGKNLFTLLKSHLLSNLHETWSDLF